MLICALVAVSAGCSETTGSHVAVGSWGVETQSGEVIAVLEVGDAGEFAARSEAGLRTGGDVRGTWSEVDESSIRVRQDGGGQTLTLEVTGDTMTAIVRGSPVQGYVRIRR